MCFVNLDSGMCAMPDISNGLSTSANQTSHVLHGQQQSISHLNILLSTTLHNSVNSVVRALKMLYTFLRSTLVQFAVTCLLTLCCTELPLHDVSCICGKVGAQVY